MELQIREKEPLHKHTTLHIGGVADYFVEVTTEDELLAALQFAEQTTATPPFILGGGSNILFPDDGFRGLVIKNGITGRQYSEEANTMLLTSGAGEYFDTIVAETVEKELWGLENLSSIPGTVGATPIQNVGAYGVEVSQLIKNVTAINMKNFSKKNFSAADCTFSYRDSFFKTEAGRDWIVTNVTFVLQKKPTPILTYGDLIKLSGEKNLTAQLVRETVKKIRAQKFPDWTEVGTAGSFFKNPIITNEHFESLKQDYENIVGYKADSGIKVSLGWILDNVCNLKGYEERNVSLYRNQALVLVVKKEATANEVKKFIGEISEIVFQKTKIKIEPEVLVL